MDFFLDDSVVGQDSESVILDVKTSQLQVVFSILSYNRSNPL